MRRDHGQPVDTDRVCEATTRKGVRCKNPPIEGQPFCGSHGGAAPFYRALFSSPEHLAWMEELKATERKRVLKDLTKKLGMLSSDIQFLQPTPAQTKKLIALIRKQVDDLEKASTSPTLAQTIAADPEARAEYVAVTAPAERKISILREGSMQLMKFKYDPDHTVNWGGKPKP